MPAPERDDTGRFPAYAWPGGYPILYTLGDCEPLCSACANGENGSDASVDHEDTQWRIVSMDVHWEGPPTWCSHCNAMIKSAYGDPDNPDESGAIHPDLCRALALAGAILTVLVLVARS